MIGLVLLSVCIGAEPAGIVAPGTADKPILSLEAAVHFALENNPTLAYQRQQHGIAAAHVIIADTYPYNPVLENRIQAANGPPAAGITNGLPLEHILLWEVELQHQGRYRRRAACAALSRTDWEIANQEQSLAVQVIRAYLGVVYRQKKLRLLEQTQRLNEQLVADVAKLVNPGKFSPADRYLAQSEADNSHDLLHAGQQRYVDAWRELCRVLGTVDGSFRIEGDLELPPMSYDPHALCGLALTRRADLHAFEMAVAEAIANLQLTKANRFGNPTVGPAYTLDPTGVNAIGVQINFPIPIPNRHRGEIAASQAERGQAVGKVEAAKFDVQNDVATAIARLLAAEERADFLRTKALPQTQQAADEMDKLLQVGQAGVDLLKIIEVRRRLLQFRDSYLDALWDVNQARADILAATGEPALGFCNPPAPQGPHTPPPQGPHPQPAPAPPATQLIPPTTAVFAPAPPPAFAPSPPTVFAPPSQASRKREDDDIWTAARPPPRQP